MAKFIKAGEYRINLSLVTEIRIVSEDEVFVSYIAAWPGDDGSLRDGRKLIGENAREFLRELERD